MNIVGLVKGLLTSAGVVAVLAWFALLSGILVGWCINIADIIELVRTHAEFDWQFALRIIGVPIPIIGAIMGIFV